MIKRAKKTFFLFLVLVFLGACTTNEAPVVNAWTTTPSLASDYKVQKGDTVYSIAWAFGMDYRDIVRYNHLQEPYELKIDQELRMSAPSSVDVKKASSAVPPPIITPVSKNPVETKPVVVTKLVVVTPAKEPKLPVTVAVTKKWLWPTKGKVIKTYSLAAGGNHGIDIAGKYSQPVLATAKGKVVYVGNSMPGYGNLIIIKHSDNELSAYAFNKTIGVKEGQIVAAGQVIARMGKNGKGKAVLHFEVRQNGKPVNPLLYTQQSV